MLVVSHAREFLNTVCTDIIHLLSRKLTQYRGNYDTFEKTAAERLRNAKKASEGIDRQRRHMQALPSLPPPSTCSSSSFAVPRLVPRQRTAPVLLCHQPYYRVCQVLAVLKFCSGTHLPSSRCTTVSVKRCRVPKFCSGTRFTFSRRGCAPLVLVAGM